MLRGYKIIEVRPTADGLGPVHRNIKSANRWLEAPNGRVKVHLKGRTRLELQKTAVTRREWRTSPPGRKIE